MRIVFAPDGEWDAVRAETSPWHVSLFGYTLPLALLPAFGWATGLALYPPGDPSLSAGAGGFAQSFVLTLALTVISVGLLALGFHLLAPAYGLARDWNAAVAVAAYGTTPLLLSGMLLVIPLLVIVSMVSLLHCFFLYYLGVTRLLGCRPADAAGFVALACVFTVIASWIVGALGSALDLL